MARLIRVELPSTGNIIESLSWKADTRVINAFNEDVWLKELFVKGKRSGITECCMGDNPCDWHRAIANPDKLRRE